MIIIPRRLGYSQISRRRDIIIPIGGGEPGEIIGPSYRLRGSSLYSDSALLTPISPAWVARHGAPSATLWANCFWYRERNEEGVIVRKWDRFYRSAQIAPWAGLSTGTEVYNDMSSGDNPSYRLAKRPSRNNYGSQQFPGHESAISISSQLYYGAIQSFEGEVRSDGYLITWDGREMVPVPAQYAEWYWTMAFIHAPTAYNETLYDAYPTDDLWDAGKELYFYPAIVWEQSGSALLPDRVPEQGAVTSSFPIFTPTAIVKKRIKLTAEYYSGLEFLDTVPYQEVT